MYILTTFALDYLTNLQSFINDKRDIINLLLIIIFFGECWFKKQKFML